jgi:dihydroorotate dehydrogenase electron transfer subunit
MPVDVHAAVLANTRLSDDYNVLTLDAPEVAALAAPGQFVMVKTSQGLDPLLRRPFSIFELLRDGDGHPSAITVMNKRVGIGTTLLFDARPGDHVSVLGPLGKPFEVVAPPARAWLVAGGVGLAPFATLAAALVRHGTDTTLFYGARRAGDLHRIELFESLGMRVVVATEDGSRGDRGFVTVPLARELEALERDSTLRLYACGPTPMMRAVSALAFRFERRCDVSLEQTMGCGMGGCFSCVVRVRRTDGAPQFVRSCLAGPIFDGRDIVWEELAGH